MPIARRAAAPEPALPPEEPEIAARLAARYLDHPLPSYPAIARREGWEGRVLLRVQVLADGRCGHAAVQSGSGYEALDRTAIDAVCGWRFVPAKRGEIAVASWVLVPLAFKLER